MKNEGKNRRLISSSVNLGLLYLLILITNSRLVASAASDPNFYYYSNGRKISLILSREKVAVRFKQGLAAEEQKAIVESRPKQGQPPFIDTDANNRDSHFIMNICKLLAEQRVYELKQENEGLKAELAAIKAKLAME